MQTREDRMLLHYKSLCKSKHWIEEVGMSQAVWMAMARVWKMPIREVREIINTKKVMG